MICYSSQSGILCLWNYYLPFYSSQFFSPGTVFLVLILDAHSLWAFLQCGTYFTGRWISGHTVMPLSVHMLNSWFDINSHDTSSEKSLSQVHCRCGKMLLPMAGINIMNWWCISKNCGSTEFKSIFDHVAMMLNRQNGKYITADCVI